MAARDRAMTFWISSVHLDVKDCALACCPLPPASISAASLTVLTAGGCGRPYIVRIGNIWFRFDITDLKVTTNTMRAATCPRTWRDSGDSEDASHSCYCRRELIECRWWPWRRWSLDLRVWSNRVCSQETQLHHAFSLPFEVSRDFLCTRRRSRWDPARYQSNSVSYSAVTIKVKGPMMRRDAGPDVPPIRQSKTDKKSRFLKTTKKVQGQTESTPCFCRPHPDSLLEAVSKKFSEAELTTDQPRPNSDCHFAPHMLDFHRHVMSHAFPRQVSEGLSCLPRYLSQASNFLPDARHIVQISHTDRLRKNWQRRWANWIQCRSTKVGWRNSWRTKPKRSQKQVVHSTEKRTASLLWCLPQCRTANVLAKDVFLEPSFVWATLFATLRSLDSSQCKIAVWPFAATSFSRSCHTLCWSAWYVLERFPALAHSDQRSMPMPAAVAQFTAVQTWCELSTSGNTRVGPESGRSRRASCCGFFQSPSKGTPPASSAVVNCAFCFSCPPSVRVSTAWCCESVSSSWSSAAACWNEICSSAVPWLASVLGQFVLSPSGTVPSPTITEVCLLFEPSWAPCCHHRRLCLSPRAPLMVRVWFLPCGQQWGQSDRVACESVLLCAQENKSRDPSWVVKVVSQVFGVAVWRSGLSV